MNDLTALHLLIIAVATWRASYMLVYESGPRKIFIHLRDLARRWKCGVFECANCTSVWVAAFMLAAMCTPFFWLVWIFAGSGMAIMLGTYTGADYGPPPKDGD